MTATFCCMKRLVGLLYVLEFFIIAYVRALHRGGKVLNLPCKWHVRCGFQCRSSHNTQQLSCGRRVSDTTYVKCTKYSINSYLRENNSIPNTHYICRNGSRHCLVKLKRATSSLQKKVSTLTENGDPNFV